MYDSYGRIVDEPDDSPPVRRTNCKRCGGFLPKDPQVYEQRDPDTGEVYDVTAIWPCKRCGYEHEANEVWE